MSGVVARSLEDVETLRPAWEKLKGGHINSDIDFFLAHARHAPQVVRPHVVLLEEGGEPAGLAVARLENARSPTRLGYAMVFNPHVRTLTVVYGGLIASEANVGKLVNAVRGSIDSREADVVRIRMLRLGSRAYDVAREEASFFRREHFRRPVTHWRSTVPGSLDEFLAARSKERRRHVRRYARRLEESCGGELEVGRFHSRSELERLFDDTFRVYQRTYQATLGVGFSRDALNRRLTEACMDRGWFRGYVLYLRGTPVAFWHGNVYGGVFWSVATGYDPAYGDARPGTYLLMRLIEDLCADESVHTIDFGFGHAEYKSTFGDESWLEEDVAVFEPRPKPVAINLGLSGVRGTVRTAQSLARRTGRLPAMRRRWRARLGDRATSGMAP
jgi:CelD/BcsL family acetyltransferase involved in cellulose biosynthesis